MLYLTPRIDPALHDLLDELPLLDRLVEAVGSPANVVLPQQAAGNLDAFAEVYRRRRLSGRIYFAHKANRSDALLRQFATTTAGVDVASLGELQHALAAGFGPDRLVATGPKNREFLWLAARTGILVSVDHLNELDELAALVRTFRLPPVRVTVRLSGFASSGVQTLSRRSRFGVPVAALPDVLDRVAKGDGVLELAGVAYHLDTIGPAEKALALENCLTALTACRDRGVRPWTIDIGGGFGVNYLADARQWDTYTSALAQAVLGNRPPMAWDGHGYGLRNQGGTLHGTLGLYPAYRAVAGPAYLDQLLDTLAPGERRPLGDLLLDHMCDLDIEPGRALLDQCGVVLTRVLSAGIDETGNTVVRVQANARDVSLEEHGVLMDPVLLRERPGDERPVEVYLLGNLCLESDLISRRKVALPARPRPGDLLAFVNTAGYFMDFSATEALRQPTGRTVAAYRTGAGWRWCLDEQYWPIHPNTLEQPCDSTT